MAKKLQIEQTVMSSDDVNSIITTFALNDDVGIVLVPLNLFIKQPEAVCDAFKATNRQIVHNNQLVNVFVENDVIFPSDYGRMDKLTRSWTLEGNSDQFLDQVVEYLGQRTTMLSLTLQSHTITKKDTNIDFVVFIKPTSIGMMSLIDYLNCVKAHIPDHKTFAVELDIGPTIELWARGVLGQDMTCIGGRLGVTSGNLFNPLFNWKTVVGCLPCLPVSLPASLVYRASRKIKYMEKHIQPQEDVCILGSKSLDIKYQRAALSDLTRISIYISAEKCVRCGLLLHPEEPSSPSCYCQDRQFRYILKQPSAEETTSFIEPGVDDTQQNMIELLRFNSLCREDSITMDNNHCQNNGHRQSVCEFEIVTSQDVIPAQ